MLVAIVVMVVGLLRLLQGGTVAETPALSTLGPLLLAADGAAWTALGLLLLLLIPVVYVLLVCAAFLRTREWRFAALTAVVLLLVLGGAAIGG